MATRKPQTPEEWARYEQDLTDKERLHRKVRRIVDADRGPVPTLSSVAGDALKDFDFPLREALMSRGETVILRAGHLAEIFAARGVGKTWLMMTFALLLSAGGSALGFTVVKRRRVLYIDGEMASYDIRDRLMLLSERLRLPLTDYLVIVGADWQPDYLPRLDTPEGQQAIAPLVDAADVVFVDNRSCLFDPEGEKDGTAWQPAGDWLRSLRKAGKAVLLAHHANRQGDARGHSVAEDPFDLILKLSWPDDYSQEQGARFLVEFTKGRGIYGPATAPFVAHLAPNGWMTVLPERQLTVEGKLREYLKAAADAGEPAKSASAAITGAKVNKAKGLAAWAVMLKSGEVREYPTGGFHVEAPF